MRPSSRPERWFRALLGLFPAEFRGDFGDEMAADFRDQRDAAASTGRRTRVARVWLRTVADFARRAPLEHLDVLGRDVGFAIRVLRRRPALAVTAIFTVAVAVGLNASVFSVVNAVLLRSLPIEDSDQLVRIFEVSPAPDSELQGASSANFVDWAARTRTLDAMTLVGGDDLTLLGSGDPERILAMEVSDGFFKVFPTQPRAGRLFTADEAQQPARTASGRRAQARSILLSHDLWLRRFGGRSDVIGTTVRVQRFGPDETLEVIGVLEPDFAGRDLLPWGRAEAWLVGAPDVGQRRARYLNAFGRLAPGASLHSAQAEFDVIAGQLGAAYPKENGGYGVRLAPLLDTIVKDVRRQLWFLFGAAFCVLLIGCANLANLLIAHESTYRPDLATRLALGASRARLLRQSVTQSVTLAVLGGGVGLLMAILTVPTLVAAAPPGIPRLDEVHTDVGVVAFTIVVSLLAGVGCGLTAHFSLGRLERQTSSRLYGADRRSGGRRLRRIIAVAEIAIALVLAVAAGLMVQTFRAVAALPLGYDPARVIAVGLAPGESWNRRKNELEAGILDRVAALPGVRSAGIGTRPLSPGGFGTSIEVPGRGAPEVSISVDPVTPGFLEALGAHLAKGRFFDQTDTANAAPRSAVLNEAAVRLLWPGGDAVGRFIRFDEREVQIVGVLADVRRGELETAPAPTVYVPSSQTQTFRVNNLLIRTVGDPKAVIPAVRAAIRGLDPTLALTRIETLDETLHQARAPRRFMMQLAGLFSILALALAMLGIYGVAAGSVIERVPEIGIRMTCGATTGHVVGIVARQVAWIVGPGILIGVTGAAALSGTIAGLVFGVKPTDPATYLTACVSLMAAALAACAFPARRAAAIDPVVALREG